MESCGKSGLYSRSPHGERGLKSVWFSSKFRNNLSLPTRGAWIEILLVMHCLFLIAVAPHTGSVD